MGMMNNIKAKLVGKFAGGALSKVFAGGITRYLLALILGLITICGVQRCTIDRLHVEAGMAEFAIDNLVAANKHNQGQLKRVTKIAQECAIMRKRASDNVLVATERLRAEQDRVAELTARQQNEITQIIDKDIKTTECIDTLPIPPRASELLIEAASSANRGSRSS